MSIDVVTFGEAMMLLIAAEPGPLEDVGSFTKATAGAETNVATGLARLGLSASWASRLGADWVGRYLLRKMLAARIDCSRVTLDPGERTGLMFKGRAVRGTDPAIEYHRKGSAASKFSPDEIDVAWLTSARHLHATGVFAALSPNCLATSRRSIALMREAGRTISFDPNLRPSLWETPERMRSVINELAAMADWVLPGMEEGRFLTGAQDAPGIARFYRAHGAKLVVVKLGPEGAYYEGEAGCGVVPGVPVSEVVDTVGAGDAFAVGVISALLSGFDAQAAVRRGTWFGARAVQALGDTEGLPTREELDRSGY